MGRDYSAATLHRLRVRHAINAFEEIIELAAQGADVEALARVAREALRTVSLNTTPAELDPHQIDLIRALRASSPELGAAFDEAAKRRESIREEIQRGARRTSHRFRDES